MTAVILVPLSQRLAQIFPTDWIEPLDGALEALAEDVGASTLDWTTDGLASRHRLVVLEPVRFDLPLVPGLALALGGRDALLEFDAVVSVEPVRVALEDVPVTLELPAGLVRAVDAAGVASESAYVLGWRLTCDATPRGGVRMAPVRIDAAPPAMIADSGVIVEAEDVHLVLGSHSPEAADTLPTDFRGLLLGSASARYVKPGTSGVPTLSVHEARIGSGGFSGRVAFGDPEAGPLTEGQLAGTEPLPAGAQRVTLEATEAILQSFSVGFDQSLPVSSAIIGHLRLPVLETWTRFRASLNGPDGRLLLELSGASGAPLFDLSGNEWLELEVESVAYVMRDGVHYAAVAGSIRPRRPALDWPKVRIERLLVGADGSIEIEGGWIDVPETVTLDFHGFTIDIDQVGLGTKEAEGGRRRWIGYSGSISLVEGIPLSASVNGLRIVWDPDAPDAEPDVELAGVGVELEIPGTLRLAGSVAYERVERDGLRADLFRGAVDLELVALRTEVAAQLIVGHLTDEVAGTSHTVLAVVLDAQLPTPIPLAASGTAITAIKGLFGTHVAPDRKPLAGGEPEPWYDWYRREEPAGDASSARDVTRLAKWRPEPGALALGAGIALGTQFDDGYSLSVKALVAVLVPGPVVIVQGSADLLKAGDDGAAEGAFTALAVFDGAADTFQINVDVQYDLSGVIAIGGGLEAFFDFGDLSRWYLHLGKKEPESKRVHAEILALLGAQTYFMIDAHGLATGAAVEFDWEAEIGPVELRLRAGIAFDAAIGWKPPQLEGALDLHGELALRVFGIGFAFLLEVLLEGRAPTPYRVYGRARVALTLPWPLADLDVTVELEWEEKAEPQPIDVFKGASLTHHRHPELGWDPTTRERDAPMVPVDSTAVLSFARPVSGFSHRLDGDDWVPVQPDVVGDWSFAYQLRAVRLEKKVADRYDGNMVREFPLWSDIGETLPFGFGDPVQSVLPRPDAQEPQLRLWSAGPFEGLPRRWQEGVAGDQPACVIGDSGPAHCVDWAGIADGTLYPFEFEHGGLAFAAGPLDGSSPRVAGGALVADELTVRFPGGAGAVSLTLAAGASAAVTAYRWGEVVWAGGVGAGASVRIGAGACDAVRVQRSGGQAVAVARICHGEPAVTGGPSDDAEGAHSDALELVGRLPLEPHTQYRLAIKTGVDATTSDGRARTIEDDERYLHFRTGGGPGSSHEDSVLWRSGEARRSFRDTPPAVLGSYVRHTQPEHGAGFAYFRDDLAVEFEPPYVEALYRPTEQLALRVADRNGRPVAADDPVWLDELLPWYSAARLAWAAGLKRDGCPSPFAPGHPRRRSLRTAVPGLRPRSRYDAVVEVVAGRRRRDAGARFSFTTSAFATAAEHLGSGLDSRGVQPVDVVATPEADILADLATADRIRLADALLAARRDLAALVAGNAPLEDIDARLTNAVEARTRLAELSAEDYERIAAATAVPWTPLPAAVTIGVIRFGDPRRDVLVLESPEPISWERIRAELRRAATARRVHAVWSADGARAFIPMGVAAVTGRWDLALSWSGSEPDLPIVTRSDPAEATPPEPVETTVILPLRTR